MKTKFLHSAFGIVFLLATFILASFNHSSATSLKHPPGALVQPVTIIVVDLQSANDFTGLQFVGILPGPDWEPQITVTGTVNYKDGKALPKTARQRLYGVQEQADFNRRIC